MLNTTRTLHNAEHGGGDEGKAACGGEGVGSAACGLGAVAVEHDGAAQGDDEADADDKNGEQHR